MGDSIEQGIVEIDIEWKSVPQKLNWIMTIWSQLCKNCRFLMFSGDRKKGVLGKNGLRILRFISANTTELTL